MSNQNDTRRIKQLIARAWRFADAADWVCALGSIDDAIRIRPKAPLCWVAKAHFLRESRRWLESEEACRKALTLDSGFDPAWTELGLLYRDVGEYRNAADCFRRSALLRPDFGVYTLLAIVELTFDPRAAFESANAALTLKPGWEDAIQVRDSAKCAFGRQQ